MILKPEDGLSFVFETPEGKKISAFIPTNIIVENLEDLAYEVLLEPECQSSSCAVNNFCECDSINEDAKFKYVEVDIYRKDYGQMEK